MAKKNKSTFAKREKELKRMRKAAEKMARRHAKKEGERTGEIEIVTLVPEPPVEVEEPGEASEGSQGRG